ncbi:MAG: hypothetical protein RIC55_00410 [Pirellulaceae bacterium]
MSRSVLSKILLAAVPAALILLLGAAVFAAMMFTRETPSGRIEADPGPLVRAFRAEPQTHQVAVTAYGTSQAEREWKAIAEVRGRAIEVHEQFDPGELVLEGTVLVQVDPHEYKNAVAQLKAQEKATLEEITRVQRSYENAAEILKLHRQQEELALAEHERLGNIRQRGGSVPQSELERVYRDYLTAKTAAEQLADERDLMPIDKARLEANLEATRAQLADAERNLEKTKIMMPFNGICVEENIEQDQIVSVGQELGAFVRIERTEVEAYLEVRKGYMLWSDMKTDIEFDLTNPGAIESMRGVLRLFRAKVQPISHPDVSFDGRVSRMRFTDPTSRTIPVVVEVDDPYRGVKIGKRPPLSPNMFCKVTLYGAVLSDVIVIPRESLRDNRVYLVRDGKLHIAEVKAPVLEEKLAVVTEGIEPGDLVLLSDVFPAVEGMPLRVQEIPNPAKARGPISEEQPR